MYDNILIKVGVEPDLALAKASKLEVDPVNGGFKVRYSVLLVMIMVMLVVMILVKLLVMILVKLVVMILVKLFVLSGEC